MTHKMALVLTFDIEDADELPVIIRQIDPPRLPGFDGNLRIVPDVAELTRWLDETDDA